MNNSSNAIGTVQTNVYAGENSKNTATIAIEANKMNTLNNGDELEVYIFNNKVSLLASTLSSDDYSKKPITVIVQKDEVEVKEAPQPSLDKAIYEFSSDARNRTYPNSLKLDLNSPVRDVNYSFFNYLMENSSKVKVLLRTDSTTYTLQKAGYGKDISMNFFSDRGTYAFFSNGFSKNIHFPRAKGGVEFYHNLKSISIEYPSGNATKTLTFTIKSGEITKVSLN